jgi:hypothetical protein
MHHFSLVVRKLQICTKRRHFWIFPIWVGMQTNSNET